MGWYEDQNTDWWLPGSAANSAALARQATSQARAFTPSIPASVAGGAASATTGAAPVTTGAAPYLGGGTVPYADLANALNTFMAGQAKNQFVLNNPLYEENTAKFAQNTREQLAGQVPQDVVNQIINRGAERGIATGSPGSPNANASWLQALGLTSIDLQKTGAANLHQGIVDTPVSPTWNPASLFVPQTLAAQELAAAQAGLRAGGGVGGSRYTGGGMPNLSMNTGPTTPASWQAGGTYAGGGGGAGSQAAITQSSLWGGQSPGLSYDTAGDSFGGGYAPDFSSWLQDYGLSMSPTTGNYSPTPRTPDYSFGGSFQTPGPSASDIWQAGTPDFFNYDQFAGSYGGGAGGGGFYDPYASSSLYDTPAGVYTPGQGGVSDWSTYGNIDWSIYE